MLSKQDRSSIHQWWILDTIASLYSNDDVLTSLLLPTKMSIQYRQSIHQRGCLHICIQQCWILDTIPIKDDMSRQRSLVNSSTMMSRKDLQSIHQWLSREDRQSFHQRRLLVLYIYDNRSVSDAILNLHKLNGTYRNIFCTHSFQFIFIETLVLCGNWNV